MQSLISAIIHSLEITAPVFVVIFLGWLFYRRKLINDDFVNTASQLVFKITLPLLIFLNIIKSDLSGVFDSKILIYALIITFIAFLFLVWRAKFISAIEDKGVFIQGAFRGNLAIMGMALINNQFGQVGIAKAALLLAVLIVEYNILSVIALSLWRKGAKPSFVKIAKDMFSNPLVISVIAALLSYELNIKFPDWILNTGSYFANMTLPLALLCIGASLKFYTLIHLDRTTSLASVYKVLILPIIMSFGAYLIGFRNMDLAILFIFFGAPSATVSFVMAKVMQGNAFMAANIVALTTLMSVFSISLGLFFLELFNL